MNQSFDEDPGLDLDMNLDMDLHKDTDPAIYLDEDSNTALGVHMDPATEVLSTVEDQGCCGSDLRHKKRNPGPDLAAKKKPDLVSDPTNSLPLPP